MRVSLSFFFARCHCLCLGFTFFGSSNQTTTTTNLLLGLASSSGGCVSCTGCSLPWAGRSTLPRAGTPSSPATQPRDTGGDEVHLAVLLGLVRLCLSVSLSQVCRSLSLSQVLLQSRANRNSAKRCISQIWPISIVLSFVSINTTCTYAGQMFAIYPYIFISAQESTFYPLMTASLTAHF